MHTTDYQRPPTLYLYGSRAMLERALTLGEFPLRANSSYLTLSFSQGWNPKLFSVFSNADCCLVIHDTERFGERLHRAVQRALPSWAGIDGAIDYGNRSPLGAAFTKTMADAMEQEWQFAWRATQPFLAVKPIVIKIGSIEAFAELRAKETYTGN